MCGTYHRPLLYGLHIEENFKVLHSYAFESKDYQVTPESPWNYALVLHDDSKPDDDLKFVSNGLHSSYPFSPDGAPSYIEAMVGVKYIQITTVFNCVGM